MIVRVAEVSGGSRSAGRVGASRFAGATVTRLTILESGAVLFGAEQYDILVRRTEELSSLEYRQCDDDEAVLKACTTNEMYPVGC